MTIDWHDYLYRITADPTYKVYFAHGKGFCAELECNDGEWSLRLHYAGVKKFKLNASDSDEAKTEAEAIIREKVVK